MLGSILGPSVSGNSHKRVKRSTSEVLGRGGSPAIQNGLVVADIHPALLPCHSEPGSLGEACALPQLNAEAHEGPMSRMVVLKRGPSPLLC